MHGTESAQLNLGEELLGVPRAPNSTCFCLLKHKQMHYVDMVYFQGLCWLPSECILSIEYVYLLKCFYTGTLLLYFSRIT